MAHADVIQEWGGYLEYNDYWRRRVTWIPRTNYTRPYWNEWDVLIEQGAGDIDLFSMWWYGEWVVTDERPDFDLVVFPDVMIRP